MTELEKIERVKTLSGNDANLTTDLCEAYLDMAMLAIYNKMHPFKDMTEDFVVPSRYEGVQCALALRYFVRQGGEGEISHSENGISRTYGSTNDEDLLREVMQVIE